MNTGIKKPKNNAKSIRMTDEVLSIVEAYQGDGFNQKFENMVMDFSRSISERETLKKSLDEEIKQKRGRLQKLSQSIDKASSIELSLERFLSSIENI